MRIKGSLAFRQLIQVKEMEFTSTRKACFLEDDNGLASIAEHGLSSSSENHHHHHLLRSPRKTNPRKYASFSHVSSPRSARFEEQQQPYFLDACFLCKKPLGGNSDIFMYRGDTAFCSEECRAEQIDNDEAKEKNWNLSVSRKSQKDKSSPNKTSKNYPFQSGALAAA